MLREHGNIKFPLWILGDSEPENWNEVLNIPFDSRHPIRHNIITSVLDVIQDKVFREKRLRVDSSQFYIRNAVRNANDKPLRNENNWGDVINNEKSAFKYLIEKNKPIIILCFGAFAFEFARRSMQESPYNKYGHWGAKALGYEFSERVKMFDIKSTNILPLLHRSIAGGNFIQSHNYFCNKDNANYFEYTGNSLGNLFLRYEDQLSIWIH